MWIWCHCTRNVDAVSQTIFQMTAAILRMLSGYKTTHMPSWTQSQWQLQGSTETSKKLETAHVVIPRNHQQLTHTKTECNAQHYKIGALSHSTKDTPYHTRHSQPPALLSRVMCLCLRLQLYYFTSLYNTVCLSICIYFCSASEDYHTDSVHDRKWRHILCTYV